MPLKSKKHPFQNLKKIAVLKSFVGMSKFDIIYISETFSNNSYRDNDINLNDYCFFQAENLSNAKRGGVCIYYKKNWQGSFNSLLINKQVNLSSSTLINICSNFIPIKIATFNDQDPP